MTRRTPILVDVKTLNAWVYQPPGLILDPGNRLWLNVWRWRARIPISFSVAHLSKIDTFGWVSTTLVLPIFRSQLQLRMLGLLLSSPDRSWTTAELADRLDAPSISVHRELRRALDAGLLTRTPVGKSYLYQAATESPLYEPLLLLVERTVGVEVELRQVLEGLPGVEAAFIHGSFASGQTIRPTSDVDVLVLGSVDPHLLRRRVRSVEKRVGREIDVLAYTATEFAALAESGNSLVREILRGPVTVIVGSRKALGEQ